MTILTVPPMIDGTETTETTEDAIDANNNTNNTHELIKRCADGRKSPVSFTRRPGGFEIET